MEPGDYIYEIYSWDNRLYINRSKIKSISKTGRIIGAFGHFEGLKPSALNQFNRQNRVRYIRGNHLNVFRIYSTEENLNENIKSFQLKFKKQTGHSIGSPVFNFGH